jgi:hypothetical protein
MTKESEIVRALRHTCDGCNPTPCCEFEALGPEAAALIESLQAKLAAEKRRADAAVEDMKLIVDAVREEHCDETCCFACKFDCDTSITDSGCYANECPGFDTNECFEWRGPQEAGKGE